MLGPEFFKICKCVIKHFTKKEGACVKMSPGSLLTSPVTKVMETRDRHRDTRTPCTRKNMEKGVRDRGQVTQGHKLWRDDPEHD